LSIVRSLRLFRRDFTRQRFQIELRDERLVARDLPFPFEFVLGQVRVVFFHGAFGFLFFKIPEEKSVCVLRLRVCIYFTGIYKQQPPVGV
jgi:hypothetical protein